MLGEEKVGKRKKKKRSSSVVDNAESLARENGYVRVDVGARALPATVPPPPTTSVDDSVSYRPILYCTVR